MSSSIDVHLDHQLQLHLQLMRYPDLHKTEYICNQSPSDANILQPKAPDRPALPIGDDHHLLRHMKLPLKLPLRRRFITLGEANSSSYVLSCKSAAINSTFLFNKRSSSLLDLAVAEGKEVASVQEELPSMEESNEEEVQDSGVEMVTKPKQKLLVQLAENPHEASTVESQYKSLQKIESSFGESSNSSRTCRICGREFPSGRALGGHMRIHGALLFAGSICDVEQERKSPSELQETIGSANHAYSGGVEVEKIRALSSNFLNSQMDPQEDEEEEEERACRTVHLSSFDCSSSLVNKADDELLGYGDANSHDLLGKRTSTPALYELRRNPKPNQRFFRDQFKAVGADWQPANSCIASSNITMRRSRSPSPESAIARSCSECGKVFMSWKALFGHMRCHPERDWRGIQPPERSLELNLTTRPSTPKASNAESVSDCQVTTATHLAFTKDQESSMKAHMQEYGALNSKLVIKSETASHVSAKDCSLYPSGREFKPQQKLTNVEEVADATEHASKKSHCKKRSMKRMTDYCKAPTIDWFPSWLTHNKRSKRTQELHLLSESKSFTSETIYSGLTPSQQYASQLESCDEFIVANSLMMLSNAGELVQQSEGSRSPDGSKADHVKIMQADHAKKGLNACSGTTIQGHVQTYCSWDGDNDRDRVDEAEIRKAGNYNGKGEISPVVKYQCSTCKKCFNSHQALGGHRASHKKMKGCFAQTKIAAKETQESNEEYIAEKDDDNDDVGAEQKSSSQEEAQEAGRRRALWQLLPEEGRSDGNTCHINAARNILASKKKSQGHECSICHRVFATGQALGGHKRCHWNGDRFVADTTSVAGSSNRQSSFDGSTCKGNPIRLAKEDAIDLNLPAPLEYENEDGDGDATFDMSTAEGTFVPEEMLGTAMAKGADVTPLGNSCVAPTSRWSNVSKNWKYQDLMSSEKKEDLPSSQTDIDASECRFHDQRFPAMWSRRSIGGNLPQVCMLEQLR